MALVGLCMARNEAGIISLVIDHMLSQGVDRIVVEDGTSTDETFALAVAAGAEVVREDHREYDQPERMTRLAAEWCSPGDWVIPFDADEFWYANNGTIRTALDDIDANKLWARMYLHRDWDYRWVDAKPLPKVAFRYWPGARLHFGNHGVDGVSGDGMWGVLDLREWQYRSFAHFVEKVEKQRDLVAHTPGLGGAGSHKATLLAMTHVELVAEWERMQEGEWVWDPIPSLLSRP